MQGDMGANCSLVQCVWPLYGSGGLRGKNITPSVGWEVPMKSHQSASWSCTERVGQRLREDDLGYNTPSSIQHGRLLFTLRFHLCTFECVKKVLT
jgi:hypothetical protein